MKPAHDSIQTSRNENLLQLIINQSRPFYERQDEWHDFRHAQRVVTLAKVINKVENANPFLVEAGAWLHQFHDPNLEELEKVLLSIPFSQSERAQLREIVEQCRPHKISSEVSREAQIVFDADALELMGPYGIVRELLCNTKDRKLSTKEALTGAHEVQKLFFAKLQTSEGKRISQEVSKVANDFWNNLTLWEKYFSDPALHI